MAAGIGRDFTITYGTGLAAEIIAGCQAKSMTINRNAIDVTTDDELGIRALLEAVGQVDVDISCDGVTMDSILRSAARSATTLLEEVMLTFADGTTFSGDVFVGSYSESGSHNDAVKFSATLMFTGTILEV